MERLPISIIIPTYNRAHLVGRAIRSALQQVRPGDEIIVVDDGSTDHTEETLKVFLGSITCIRTKNAGAGAARNRGIKMAKNPLIAFLDSDDEWVTGKLELQRRLLEARPDILFAFSDFAVVRDNGEIVHRYLRYWHRTPSNWDLLLSKGVPYSSIAPLPDGFPNFGVHFGNLFIPMLTDPYVLTDTVLVRREDAGESLYFDEDVALWEDYLCFGRLAQKGRAAFLDVETAWQYGHSETRLTDADELVRAATRAEVLKRLWNLDPEYLEDHRDQYHNLLDQQYCWKAGVLITLGRTKEAHAELRMAKNVPWHYRLAATLPGPGARSLVLLRNKLRTWVREH